MFRNTVGTYAFVTFGKKIIGLDFAAGACHATHACNQNCFAINRFPANERPKRNENAGWITTRARDKFGIADFIPINFRQTVN